MKVFFRRIHLYLALVAGLVITVTCFTGAVLVFEEELQHLIHKERYFSERGQQAMPVQSLLSAVKAAHPEYRVTAVRIYSDPLRTAELTLAEKEKGGKKAAGGAGAQRGEGGKKAFVDRYTGKITAIYEYRKSGFYTMFALHRWLLGGETGKLIVGISTVIFLFILITGIILWWPRNRLILRQRLKLKWNAGWKRLNHDYHIVLGFYSAIFLFIFAFTGLAWSFEWFNKGIYVVTNSEQKPPQPPHSIRVADSATHFSADAAASAVLNLEPGARWYNIAMPKGDSAALTVTVLPSSAAHEAQTTAYHFDQYTGALLQRIRFEDRNAGQRVRATFKPVHTGSIWGWPSRGIALLACLAGTFFPISGYIMWLNRTLRKSKRKKLVYKIKA